MPIGPDQMARACGDSPHEAYKFTAIAVHTNVVRLPREASWRGSHAHPAYFVALGAFRATVGHQVAALAARYGIDVEGPVASIMPTLGRRHSWLRSTTAYGIGPYIGRVGVQPRSDFTAPFYAAVTPDLDKGAQCAMQSDCPSAS